MAQLIVAAAIGLIFLPLLFGGETQPGAIRAWIWIALSVLASAWMLFPSPALTTVVGNFLDRLPVQPAYARIQRQMARDVARLSLTVGYVILIQGTLRQPLVAAIGREIDSFIVEASVAAVALVAVLIVFGWVHHAARPFVEGVAWAALDSLIPTTGSEALASAARAHERSTRASESTRLAPAAADPTRTGKGEPIETISTQTATTRPSGK